MKTIDYYEKEMNQISLMYDYNVNDRYIFSSFTNIRKEYKPIINNLNKLLNEYKNTLNNYLQQTCVISQSQLWNLNFLKSDDFINKDKNINIDFVICNLEDILVKDNKVSKLIKELKNFQKEVTLSSINKIFNLRIEEMYAKDSSKTFLIIGTIKETTMLYNLRQSIREQYFQLEELLLNKKHKAIVDKTKNDYKTFIKLKKKFEDSK